MESDAYNSWEVIPFGRTFIPIYALLSIQDSVFPAFLPTLLLLRNDGYNG